jgi:hypothetical protein
MTKHSANCERTSATAYDAFEGPVMLRAADSISYDDDAVMDAWLASMDPREFELVLTHLAETDAHGAAKLEFSA